MKDEMGRFRTVSLFWENRRNEDKYPPIFTTKPYDHTVDGKTYPSLKLIYMEYEHIPEFEYDFAMDVFGSWDQWQQLCNKSIIRNIFKEWREELEIKLRARGVKQMITMSLENDSKGLQAAKYLSDKGWVQSEKKTRGRPSKDEIKRIQKEEAAVRDTLSEDMERLGLKVIPGGG